MTLSLPFCDPVFLNILSSHPMGMKAMPCAWPTLVQRAVLNETDCPYYKVMSSRMLSSRVALTLSDEPTPCALPPMTSMCSQEACRKKQWSHRAKKEVHSNELNLVQVLCASHSLSPASSTGPHPQHIIYSSAGVRSLVKFAGLDNGDDAMSLAASEVEDRSNAGKESSSLPLEQNKRVHPW